MRITWIAVHLMIALMVLVPFSRYLEGESEASGAIPVGCRPNLLLTRAPITIPPDRLRLLDKTVISSYVVGPRESFWGIHQKFNVDEDTIRSSNSEDSVSLASGKVLQIPNHRGTLYQVKPGETLETISKKFAWGRRDPASFIKTVLSLNDYPTPDLRAPGHPLPANRFLFLPNTVIKYWALDIPVAFAGRLRISSGFGSRFHPILHVRRQHDGWDIPKPYGSPVLAAQGGQVTFTGWSEGYGNLIILTHSIKGKKGYNTLTTRYGHLSKILVEPGQRVRQGQLIGRVGSTGISTGPHLHFEIRDASGQPRNPKYFTH